MFWKKPKVVDSDKVSDLLEKAVLMAFKATNNDSYVEWLKINSDAAVATLRFQAAAAWVFADIYIQEKKLDGNVIEDVMKKWRSAIFHRLLSFLDANTEAESKAAWECLFDDVEHANKALMKVLRDKPPYAMAAFAKHWFKDAIGVDFYKQFDFQGAPLLIISAVSDSQIRIENILREQIG